MSGQTRVRIPFVFATLVAVPSIRVTIRRKITRIARILLRIRTDLTNKKKKKRKEKDTVSNLGYGEKREKKKTLFPRRTARFDLYINYPVDELCPFRPAIG